jgi:hypothetical protein
MPGRGQRPGAVSNPAGAGGRAGLSIHTKGPRFVTPARQRRAAVPSCRGLATAGAGPHRDHIQGDLDER